MGTCRGQQEFFQFYMEPDRCKPSADEENKMDLLRKGAPGEMGSCSNIPVCSSKHSTSCFWPREGETMAWGPFKVLVTNCFFFFKNWTMKRKIKFKEKTYKKWSYHNELQSMSCPELSRIEGLLFFLHYILAATHSSSSSSIFIFSIYIDYQTHALLTVLLIVFFFPLPLVRRGSGEASGERDWGRVQTRGVCVRHLQTGKTTSHEVTMMEWSSDGVITSRSAAPSTDLGHGSVGVLHLHRHHRDFPRRHRWRKEHGGRWRSLEWVSTHMYHTCLQTTKVRQILQYLPARGCQVPGGIASGINTHEISPVWD